MKSTLLSLFLSVAVSAPALAQTVPSGMTYQGRLTDASNGPVPDGTGYEIEVRLWSASTGGTLLWGARYTGVPLKSGAFNLILGSGGNPIPGATHTDLKLAFNTPTVHLGLTPTKSASGAAISPATEILPHQQIFSTPYAFRADVVSANGVDTFAIKDGGVKTADIESFAVGANQLANQAVTAEKIANESIISQNIAMGGILPNRLSHDFAFIVDEKPTNTPGGSTIAGTWLRRDLNKISSSQGDSISIANHAITLKTGTYFIEAKVPSYESLVSRAALRRVNESTPVLYGNTIRCEYLNTIFSAVDGVVTVTLPSESYEIWQYAQRAAPTNGLGHPSNTPPLPEVYTTVKIVRLK